MVLECLLQGPLGVVDPGLYRARRLADGLGDLGDREVVEEMKDEYFTMLQLNPVERPMHGLGILDVERHLLVQFLWHRLGTRALGSTAGLVVTDAVDGPVVRDPVQPGTDRSRVFEPSDRPERRQPDFLKDVEGGILVGQELGRIIKQRPFQLANQLGERLGLPQTAPEGDPFIVCSTRLRVHSDLESERDHRRFNGAAGNRDSMPRRALEILLQ
jgi:hypothetical protein